MEKSRTSKSVKNIWYSFIFQLVTLLSNFVMKTVFIKFLGIQYTGVSTLFTDILTVLSMAELGFGVAIAYTLYRPLHLKDDLQVAKLMKLYKRIYRIIAGVIMLAGCCCLPLIPLVVKDVPDIKESLYVIFILFIVKTASSYLFIYKATLLEANQQKSVASGVGIIFCIFSTAIEAVILVVFREYLLYLAVSIVLTILKNFVVSKIADRHFPILKERCDEELTKEEKSEIFGNVRALAIYKVSGALQKGIDSIIISTVLGTGMVGFLSYYRLIVNNVDGLFGQIFESMKPSVGNLVASESVERQFSVFNFMSFAAFVIGNFIAASLLVLLNPFIELWLGAEFLLDMGIVIMLVADAYIITMVRPYENFRVANGLFVQGKYRPAIMCIINIVLSIIFAKIWGIFGVLLATVISRISTHVWYDPWLIYRKVFHRPFIGYIKKRGFYLLVVIANCCLTWFAASLVSTGNAWFDFILKAVFCVVIPNFIVCILFFKSDNFKQGMGYLKNIVAKFKK